jgi:hypothetical protein
VAAVNCLSWNATRRRTGRQPQRRCRSEEARDSGIARFAVAYLAVLKVPRAYAPEPKHVPVVGLAAHDTFGEHHRCSREILSVNRRFILAAMGPLRPAADSIYANILESAVRLQAAS